MHDARERIDRYSPDVRAAFTHPGLVGETGTDASLTDRERYRRLVDAMDSLLRFEADCQLPSHRQEALRLVRDGDENARCRFLVRAADEDLAAWNVALGG